jgi:hypothetical protein
MLEETQEEIEDEIIEDETAETEREGAAGNAGDGFRDDSWLTARVRLLREIHFADVPQGYPIVTRFGTRARYRFGSIAARNRQTIILINRLFADPYVPTFVVDGTLAHELAHYAHGFGSGLPRLYRDAHRGGVVDKELEKRGLGEVNARAEQWRKIYWDVFYDAQCDDLVARRASRTDEATARWQAFLMQPDRRTPTELQARFGAHAARLGYAHMPLPFRVEWLAATRRQTAPSYWFARERALRLHGLLADPRVPDQLVDFELAYWLARLSVGESWQAIHAALCRADLSAAAGEALDWRKRRWHAFRLRHHPLNPPPASGRR